MIFRSGCFFFLCIYSVVLFSAQLKSVVLKQQGNQTSLYFAINGPFAHRLFFLDHPERVVVDLKETRLGVNLNDLGLINGLVRKVRSGYSKQGVLRVVFEVNHKVQLHSSPWHSQNTSHGVRVDLVQTGPFVPHQTVTRVSPQKVAVHAATPIKTIRHPKVNLPVKTVRPIVQSATPLEPIKIIFSPVFKACLYPMQHNVLYGAMQWLAIVP